ncbi:MAG: sigma-54-dependent Fis family transcriptional regulator [Desulfobacteraceae bacterium]|nr:sigma-54-dependent Fis family transcriptional regulator [Desulfobacteraceae bacterium]MBC2756256.1 sigma-54-dependent Fis family transcriptional regulator [Desulfobacteraceae bacterium]
MAKIQLNSEEKEFLTQVCRATFTNPFSDERTEIDIRLSGVSPAASESLRINKVVDKVSGWLQNFERNGKANVTYYGGEDRELVEKAFLFEVFYRFKDKFDQLILNQIENGDTPVKIPFLSEVLSSLMHKGLSEELSRRYFALGFQMRRAFYFIKQSLIGNSASMKSLRLQLWNNVFTHNIDFYNRYLWNKMEDFSTLLLGETGTGKGTAALAIGRSGFIPLDKRKKSFEESFTRSFVSLNLSQYPETLIESALFGHKKGAFTGAIENYQGVFDQCSPYGSILLDEIGEVSKPIQIKLLQVLQERLFTPVGSQKKNRFQGRVITATNRPLKKLRGEGIFRDDFYYRLCSDIIVVPPLRQRTLEDPSELDTLLGITIKRLIGRPSPELEIRIRNIIDTHLGPEYLWPGNVRELEQCVRRIFLKGMYSGDDAINDMDLEQTLMNGIDQGNIDSYRLTSGYCYLLYQRHQTFEEVARRTGLDRRTVKKYIQDWKGDVVE